MVTASDMELPGQYHMRPFGNAVVKAAVCMAPVLVVLLPVGPWTPLSAARAKDQVRSGIAALPAAVAETVGGPAAGYKAEEANEQAAILKQRRDDIFNDPSAPVRGNPQGDATLVVFFDYNCLYCRRAAAILDELEQDDNGVRLVFKEFPTLGPGSMFAARAALASQKQGQYRAFHKAMMTYREAITEASVLEIATQVGLDIDTLKENMQDRAISNAIRRNTSLAVALHLHEPPAFIVENGIRSGLIDLNTLKQLIAAARKQ